MTAVLLWSNDPEFYDMVWGENADVGKPLIKVGADPAKIIERFRLQEAPKEPWMIQSYQGSSGNYKYILVVFERITDDVRAFIGNIGT